MREASFMTLPRAAAQRIPCFVKATVLRAMARPFLSKRY